MNGSSSIVSEECQRWDERYATEPLFFGDAPNPYLVATVERWFPAMASRSLSALCLGEGEGRDALFLARRGFTVTAVDGSLKGLEKLSRRAGAEGLAIQVMHADLAHYEPASRAFDLVSSFFCHLPPELRRTVHERAVRALRPGGFFVLEGFTPRQRELGLTSGGPKDVRLLFEPAVLRSELERRPGEDGLELFECEELVEHLDCGRHQGEARVVRLVGRVSSKFVDRTVDVPSPSGRGLG
ncbi:class I SAM-dependent methyltransferase [Archangium minus]|uniref:Class I SAM-dependent methyltransferase n=1 Tax=Archangium minus TaxID=83450 RepID=A0ABY9WPV0_9BACT|nr:class I SAM-dependent methyltransferase [Archangium minus]